MTFRRILFVLIALCVSGATVFLDRAWLGSTQVAQTAAPAPAAERPVVQVLVARGPLAAGQFVRPDSLRWQAWPDGNIAPDYVVDSKAKLEDFVGAVVRSGMGDGEPITDRRIVRPGDRGFMAAVLSPGYRAVTVPVTVSSGIAGFVFPGDRVDLLLTLTVQDDGDVTGTKRDHRASETLLTDVRVLAVNQRADDQTKDIVVAKTATLEVTPKQAETIAVAVEMGQLSLSLRSLAHGDGPETAVRFSHTFDSDATHLISPPGRSTTRKVSIARGDKVEEINLSRSGR